MAQKTNPYYENKKAYAFTIHRTIMSKLKKLVKKKRVKSRSALVEMLIEGEWQRHLEEEKKCAEEHKDSLSTEEGEEKEEFN